MFAKFSKLSLVSLGLILAGCCVINRPPVARFSWSPTSPTINSPVTFQDSSYDPDGHITLWEWDFGDGRRGSGPAPSHTYTREGTYPVTLTVTDNCGAVSTATGSVVVQSAGEGPRPCPPFEARVWLDRTTLQIGEEVVVHLFFSQPVLATLTVRIVATGAVRTVFSNMFFAPGNHDFRTIVGQPEGERIMTLTAVDSCGQVRTATFAYRAWGPAPPIIGPGVHESDRLGGGI